jgi:serine/threonine protein kinase
MIRALQSLSWAATGAWDGVDRLAKGSGSPPEGAAADTLADTLPDPFPGEFRVCRLLGAGTFGQVWLADDLHLGRPVALKALPAHGWPEDRKEASLALRREATLLAALDHRHIVKVYAWREARGHHYLVLQYVAGGSLAARVRKEGPLAWPLAARYIADVGEGLLEVHRCGIVHRDVKPANILWDPQADEALLTDFGVSARLTEAGTTGGTPYYMPLEAFDGHVSPALDVYGLAASLFCLVTGSVPFPARTLDDLRGQIARGLPEPEPRCVGLPEPLECILRAGLAAEPEDRPTLSQFIRALRGSLNLLLADSLNLLASQTPRRAQVDLRLIISRSRDGRFFEPVATTHPHPEAFLRDLKRVPRMPDQVKLQTGDRVRIEIVSDRPGFVTVFGVGPTGNLNLLYPGERSAARLSIVEAHRPLHILDVELTPPTGRERLVALWSRQPLPIPLNELLSLVERGIGPDSGPSRATRDIVRVQESIQRLQPEDWKAVVLELNHLPPVEDFR